MKEFLEVFIWINYPKVEKLQFIFSDTFIHILHALIFTYIVWRLITLIWAVVFKEQIGPIYGGWSMLTYRDRSIDWEEWHLNFWVGWLLLDGIAGFLLIISLPFILYGLIFIWPLWLFVGLLFLIRWIKNIDFKKKVKPKNIYKTSLMKGL